MPKKRKAKFDSLSTPGLKQDCSNYLVELVFLRQNHGKRLPERFWQQTRYKTRYKNELIACRKFIKKYGEALVLRLALEDSALRSWRDYGIVEMALQKRLELKKLLAAPKDNTDVKEEVVQTNKDLRPPRKKSTPRLGLFERLAKLTGE